MAFGRKKEPDDPAEYVARKDYDRAIAMYRDRLSKQPENSNLQLALGDTLLVAGRTDEAIKEFSKLAGQYTAQGFIVKAIAIYKKILRLRPTMKEIEHYLLELSDKRDYSGITRSAPKPAEPARPESKSESAPFPETETVLFRHLSPEEFREVVSRLTLRHYEEETLIVSEGDPGNSMFVIVNGEVRVTTKDPSGKQITLANLGEGEFFGEVSLLTARPRTASIVTNIATDLLELTREDYENIVMAYPHVGAVLKEWHHKRAYKTVEAIIQAWRDKQ